jgi:hypothetical protein
LLSIFLSGDARDFSPGPPRSRMIGTIRFQSPPLFHVHNKVLLQETAA